MNIKLSIWLLATGITRVYNCGHPKHSNDSNLLGLALVRICCFGPLERRAVGERSAIQGSTPSHGNAVVWERVGTLRLNQVIDVMYPGSSGPLSISK